MTVQRRNTQQRSIIDELLSNTAEMTSAQTLHGMLRDRGSAVGLATVYRALQEMALSGELDTVRSENGEVLYRRCAKAAHHHHLVCRSCGRTEEVKAIGVERWARSTAEQFGYADVDHHVELFGICASCAASC